MNRKQPSARKIAVRSVIARRAWDHPGAGRHETAPNRQRTRNAILAAALADYDDEDWEDYL